MPRRYVSCDRCGFGAWIGPHGEWLDAWCEACQRPAAIRLTTAEDAPRCEACAELLTLGAPRFEELFGELQNLVAVLEAWNGAPARLATLVPERPRFLADLDPPPTSADDPAAVRGALEALAAGAFRAARERLEAILDPARTGGSGRAEPRLWIALGIARQRLDDLTGAEGAFTHALEAAPDHPTARLDRGALRARRGDFVGAREDWVRAGDRPETRWNRAAGIVVEAVAAGTGLPEPELLGQARAEAGPPSSSWSDHTVGRLLFTLLVERARARGVDDGADARSLRAAERALEFDTFDDRALVLHGYAALGLSEAAAAVAAPLAAGLAARLAREPFARGAAGRWLGRALEAAARRVREARPAEALAAVAPLLEREDLRRYRLPCARCGAGTVGIERVEDEAGIEAPETLDRSR